MSNAYLSCAPLKIRRLLISLWKQQPFRGDGPFLGPERRVQRNILVFALRVSPRVADSVRGYKAGLRESPVPMPRLHLFPEDLSARLVLPSWV